MGVKFIRNRIEYEDLRTIWTRWIDDDLDSDAVDLDEWAFWQGYNED